MSDHNNVRIPLRHEDAGRRKINGVVTAVVFAAAAALGVTYFLVPKVNQAQHDAIARHQVTVLDEDGNVVATRSGSGRPQVMIREGEGEGASVRVVRASTPEQYRQATGRKVDFLDIVRATDGSPYIGKILRLDDVNVPLVAGDQVFTIGPSDADSILVKITEPTDPNNKSEQELVVNEGDRLMVVGRLRPYPSAEKERRFGLSSAEQARIGNKTLYVEGRLIEEVQSNGPDIPKP
jgi:archaeosine-15-forming tRNA-guanine transglycosylase